MGFRSIIISNKVNLSLKNNGLIVEKDGEAIAIPLEDIGSVVFESNKISVTTRILSALAESNITVFTCDDTHMPNGVLLSFVQHSRQSKIAKLQIECSEPFKKRIWQSIIKQKIFNQGECLHLRYINSGKYLFELSKRVKSGDAENIEARAAQYYFSELLGFARAEENTINGALNYGYAIIRGAVARSLCAHGLYPPIGIFHKSELNEYNLVDDFIEPFRPYVDIFVSGQDYEESLTREQRNDLVAVLHNDCLIDKKLYSVEYAIEIMISSYITCLNTKDYKKLKLPTVIMPSRHAFE